MDYTCLYPNPKSPSSSSIIPSSHSSKPTHTRRITRNGKNKNNNNNTKNTTSSTNNYNNSYTSSNANNHTSNNKGKIRLSRDPQSVAARERRHRISERFKILQSLIPGGAKLDTVSLLDHAIHYVHFLKSQICWFHHQTLFNNNNNNNNSIINHNNNNNNPTLVSSSNYDYHHDDQYYSCALMLHNNNNNSNNHNNNHYNVSVDQQGCGGVDDGNTNMLAEPWNWNHAAAEIQDFWGPPTI